MVRDAGSKSEIGQTVAVFGLGKVGTALCAALLDAGFSVVGYDAVPEVSRALRCGEFVTQEPGVEAGLTNGSARFTVAESPLEAVNASSISFVIVPTPSNGAGGFSNRFVLSAAEEIGSSLREKNGFHVVSIVSTMLPGSSESMVIPALERASGKRAGMDFGYAYNPAFIALGEVVRNFREPTFVLMGAADPRTQEILTELHTELTTNHPPFAQLSVTEAEITKLASNAYETSRVSFVNMLGELCDRLPGTNVDNVTNALYHRFSKRFFRGAVPYGGPCWPRDNIALAAVLRDVGASTRLPESVDLFNHDHGELLLRRVLNETTAGDRVGLVGIGYKVGTPHLDESFGIWLGRALAKCGRTIMAWDPMVRSLPDAELTLVSSAEELFKKSSFAVIINPLRELNRVDWSSAAQCTVFDPWRVVMPLLGSAKPRAVIEWGRHGEDDEFWGGKAAALRKLMD